MLKRLLFFIIISAEPSHSHRFDWSCSFAICDKILLRSVLLIYFGIVFSSLINAKSFSSYGFCLLTTLKCCKMDKKKWRFSPKVFFSWKTGEACELSVIKKRETSFQYVLDQYSFSNIPLVVWTSRDVGEFFLKLY